MKLCEIADATVTHTGSSYLANVSIQDNTGSSTLDLLSGRTFIWGFTQYVITITRFLAPAVSPSAIKYTTEDVTVNGHTFAGCYPVAWNLTTDKSRVSGGFMLQETLVYMWFKQNPPAIA